MSFLLQILFQKNRSFIIIGDFNVDVLNIRDIKTRKLGDLLKTFDLHWSVNSPTRVTATTATAIDNVITNMPSVAVSLIVTAISDHDAQLSSPEQLDLRILLLSVSY
ncbi:hypothetical protein J6590_033934 [Homalodisca vitripennis]|nr:hypothetical protein J6590_033934 [Homalodisca vitripennis]